MLIIKGELPRWSRGKKEAAVAATLQPGERLTEVARAIGADRSMAWAERKALRGVCNGEAAPAITFAPVAIIPDAGPKSRRARPRPPLSTRSASRLAQTL